jgi:hypothetical protein
MSLYYILQYTLLHAQSRTLLICKYQIIGDVTGQDQPPRGIRQMVYCG